MKKIPYILLILLFAVFGFSSSQPANAATQMVTGSFVDVTFSEYANPNGVLEKKTK